MKNLFTLLLIIFTFISCNDAKKNTEGQKEDKLTLEGTWELTSYYNYEDNKISDSFGLSDGTRQVKMYTATNVMWARKVPSDSTEFFGFGKYTITDTSLVETLDYGSAFMNQAIEENIEFPFELELEKDRFIQIDLDEDGNRIFSENYVRIE
jgi:hypothetical protein